jgi:hypothetical protein
MEDRRQGQGEGVPAGLPRAAQDAYRPPGCEAPSRALTGEGGGIAAPNVHVPTLDGKGLEG